MRKLFLICLLAAGCGGGSSSNITPPQNASVAGQYNLVLVSTKGSPGLNIYSNFTMGSGTFTGSTDTLVCTANDPSQCEGDDSAVQIVPTGTIAVNAVTITVTFPSPSGNITASLTGQASGTSLSGTYTTSAGDSGNWTGAPARSLSGTYTGSLVSNANPVIPPTLTATLTQDSSLNLTGTATISNSCLSSISLSGQTIGGALELTSPTVPNSVIVGLPDSGKIKFSYAFGASTGCPGDSGTGTVVKQ